MDLDGFVLAGGASRRMGFDKARASVGGWPMAVRVVEVLRGVADRVALVRRGPPDGLPWIDTDLRPIEVVREDPQGPRHPLWGLAKALTEAQTAFVLVAPCDVLGLSHALLERLMAAAPATARDSDRHHPLVGVFPKAEAARAARLATEGASARAFVASFATVDVPGAPLRNVNRPEDGVDSAEDVLRSLSALRFEDRGRAVAAEVTRRLLLRGARIPWRAGETP